MEKCSADIVHHEVDPADMPALSGALKAELAALAARPNTDIDYCDIPPLAETFWHQAERGRFHRPVKQQIATRVDADAMNPPASRK
ncbi:cytoplasmic protein [Sphingomonas sp. AR_OL41]|uniref:cytoplasmic protein n=1 Tax=Sphingomonas sp. AR_OL41 TaxID=3042729 RepID=UPI00247FCE91|nr:cytoplasmic protein [Sphingomonas sp. AR_OL41]MDH7973481.1 cytoplasmic protein [Sphingomonas sp. AR_OL41]